jgi:hypothetical protein
MKNYIIMIINALILIIIGAIGFIKSGSPTALIADGVGLILLILAIPTKKDNAIAAHIAVVLTFVTAVSFIAVGIIRSNAMIIVMGAVSFVAVDLYIFSFIKRRKSKNSSDDSKSSDE